jgi:phenylpropionate dioxygenase-like ring-hydroxylating dioxygenase large terminal subunit
MIENQLTNPRGSTEGTTPKSPNRSPEVVALLGCLAELVRMDVEMATGLPAGLYTSRAFYAAEQAALFEEGWLCVGREDDVPAPGDYLVSDIGALSLATLRGQDGVVRNFANTCLHRMTRLLSGKGNCRGRIVCPYHAWTYRDDGRLDAAPHMEKAVGFDVGALRLKELRTELWEGFIFATMNPTTAPVAERLRPIEHVVGRYRAVGYGKVLDLDVVSEANWKLIHENFMETYHLPFVHRTSLGKQESIGVAAGFDSSDAYSIHRTVKHRESPRGIAHPSNDVLTGEWRQTTVVLSVFPSLLLILCPDHLWYLLTHPVDVGQTHVTFGLSYAPEVLADVGKKALADTWRPYYVNLNGEDRAIVESIQEAARSPLATPGRLSPLERFTLDLARYLVAGVR